MTRTTDCKRNFDQTSLINEVHRITNGGPRVGPAQKHDATDHPAAVRAGPGVLGSASALHIGTACGEQGTGRVLSHGPVPDLGQAR